MKRDERGIVFLFILIPLLFAVLLKLNPQTEQVRTLWQDVNTSSKARDYEANLVAYDALKQIMPWRTADAVFIAEAAFQTQDWETVVESYTVLQPVGLSRADLYRWAEAEWQLENFEKAQAVWDKIREMPENQIPDFQQLLSIQQQHQDWFGAYQTLLTWQIKYPQDTAYRYPLALSQLIYDPPHAQHSLSRVLDSQPQSGDAIKAYFSALPALLEEENSVMRLMIAGNLLSRQNEWGYAAAAYALVTKTVPDYPEGWALYSHALYYLGLDGGEALRTAQGLNAEATLVQAISAYSLRREARYAESLKVWENLSEREAENAVWVYERGVTHALAGDLELALADFQLAASIQDDDPYYWRELARFCLDYSIGLDSIGISAARTALALDPQNSESNDLMGWIFFNLDDYVSAERFLEKAKQQAPYAALVHLHLGQVYLQQNKLDLAAEHLKISIQFAQNPHIKAQAERLMMQYIKN